MLFDLLLNGPLVLETSSNCFSFLLGNQLVFPAFLDRDLSIIVFETLLYGFLFAFEWLGHVWDLEFWLRTLERWLALMGSLALAGAACRLSSKGRSEFFVSWARILATLRVLELVSNVPSPDPIPDGRHTLHATLRRMPVLYISSRTVGLHDVEIWGRTTLCRAAA